MLHFLSGRVWIFKNFVELSFPALDIDFLDHPLHPFFHRAILRETYQGIVYRNQYISAWLFVFCFAQGPHSLWIVSEYDGSALIQFSHSYAFSQSL